MKARFKCKLCSYKSSVKQLVHNHIDKDHSNLENSRDMKTFKRSNTCYSCSVCGVEEESFYPMLEHMKVLHSDYLKEPRRERRDRGKAQKTTKIAQPKTKVGCEFCDFNKDEEIANGANKANAKSIIR